MEHISNFELYGNEGFTKLKPFRCFEKINIFLFLSFAIEIVYLICVLYVLNNKTYLFIELNYRKYELNSNNQKLNHKLYQAIDRNYSYDKEIGEKENNIKKLEEYINNYNQISKELLNSDFTNNELYIKLRENNNEKNIKIEELKLIREKSRADIKQIIDSNIIDKKIELTYIINLIGNINPNEIKHKFRLCYRGEKHNFNFTKAYEKCEIVKNQSFLLLFQTNIFKRYGAYISNNNEQNSINFAILPNGFINGTKIEYLDLNRKKSLIYIINLIKKNKYDNNKNSLDFRSFINDFELFII